MQHFIGKDGSVFDLVVQRKLIAHILLFYWQTQAVAVVALKQTNCKTGYKYQNTRHWH
jgi:hypothetical protein